MRMTIQHGFYTGNTSGELARITQCYACFYYATDDTLVQALLLNQIVGNDRTCVNSLSTNHVITCSAEGSICATLTGQGVATYSGKLQSTIIMSASIPNYCTVLG